MCLLCACVAYARRTYFRVELGCVHCNTDTMMNCMQTQALQALDSLISHLTKRVKQQMCVLI